MIHITEDKLRAAIQIFLGSEGLHNGKLENNLVHDIKALSIADVSNQRELLSGFREWYNALSVEEINWYEGKFEEVYLATL